jgi:predicted acylesterase/phospholipase RssA
MIFQTLSAPDFLKRSYQNIVFAGGGNRCWWQAGVVEALSQHACWQAKRLVGASAGAGIATAFATGRIQNSLTNAIERFNATPRNIEWRNLLNGKRPFVLPSIYPDWIGSFLDAADLAKLKLQQLKVEVVITRPIAYLPLTLSTLVALALYSSEKYWLKNFHARLPHYLGLRAEYLDLARSANLDEARTLLLASAAAVPITPLHRVNGRAALDGGFYDSVPLPQDRADDASTLVLLTRHRPDLPQIFMHKLRVYLQPLRAVAATNMDCTSGTNVRLTHQQGQQEALRLMA